MSDHNKDYQAKTVADMVQRGDGSKLPTIEEIVLQCLISKGAEMKVEEILDYVSIQTGFPTDDSIRGAVSGSLRKLQNEEKVVNTSYGFWKAN